MERKIQNSVANFTSADTSAHGGGDAASPDPGESCGLPDILAADLPLVFCGLNPGLKAAGMGHHFAGQGNRFWRVLHLAGFTPEEISPVDDASILQFGCGLTTVVARPTAGANEVAGAEFRKGGALLRLKMGKYAPRNIAFLGKAAFAAMTAGRKVSWGRQRDPICGATVWILPNPSGRNRSFSLAALVEAYSRLHGEIDWSS